MSCSVLYRYQDMEEITPLFVLLYVKRFVITNVLKK